MIYTLQLKHPYVIIVEYKLTSKSFITMLQHIKD